MQSQISEFFPEDNLKIKCGCYIRRPAVVGIKYQRALVPLRHIDYQLEIVNSLVNITLTQKYYNPTDKFLQVDYSLPLSPDSSVYRFEAEFGNVKIEGIVKEKEQAKKEYEQAKSEGKQAVIGTIDPDSKDILNMEIGNIPPLTEFTVTISLLQEMKVSQNTFYRLQVPSTISPRFMNKVEGKTKVSEHMQHKGESSGKPDFDWSFKVDLRTTRKVVFFDSPSHDITLLSQNAAGTQTLLVMEKSQVPNKDFVFVYTTENFHLPSYVVGATDTSSTVMLSFIPKFCTLELTDAYKAAVENKAQETDMAAAKGDYVFLLDRSGSMGGTRINKAKEALVLFLKSLPADSYFNVISFGNNSTRMFNTSEKNNSKKIQQSVNQIQKMNADMGGTEIYQPLSVLLQQKVIEGYPRHIFLLTDGGVSNTQGVLNIVKKNTKYCRVHSIGIGNGASFDLIQGCANNGKGKYVMIADDENPSEKIIQLLETTLTPLISKIDLKYDNEKAIQSVIPNPKSIPYILKDEAANFYITFNGPLTEKHNFTFEYEDSVSKLPYKATVEVDPTTALNQPFVNKMAHLKVLRALENSARDGVVVEEQMHYVKVKDFKEEAVKYSVKHQVLSEFTAFLCVGKELVDGQYQEFKNKGVEQIYVEQPKPVEHVQQDRFRTITAAIHVVGAYNNAPVRSSAMNLSKKSAGTDFNILSSIGSAASSIASSVTGIFGKRAKMASPVAMKQLAPRMQMEDLEGDKYQQDQEEETANYRQKRQEKKQMVHQQVQQKKKAKKKSQVHYQKQKSSKPSSAASSSLGSISSSSTSATEISQIIQQQSSQGSWNSANLIDKLSKNPKKVHELAAKFSVELVVTKLVILWMQKYHNEKQYSLIIKKAIAWVKKYMESKEGQAVQQAQINVIQCV